VPAAPAAAGARAAGAARQGRVPRAAGTWRSGRVAAPAVAGAAEMAQVAGWATVTRGPGLAESGRGSRRTVGANGSGATASPACQPLQGPAHTTRCGFVLRSDGHAPRRPSQLETPAAALQPIRGRCACCLPPAGTSYPWQPMRDVKSNSSSRLNQSPCLAVPQSLPASWSAYTRSVRHHLA
jgi:hypothetical protein